jgi:hypothetical protein
MRLVLTGLLALVAALLPAAPAWAAPGVVTRTGTTLKVDFGNTVSGDSLHVWAQGGSGGTLELTSNAPGGAMTDMAASCAAFSANRVDCDVAGATKLVVELGPGEDFTEFQVYEVPVDVEVYGEDGSDSQLWGTGRDDLIDGGPGDDGLDGFFGDDTLRGGTGDDFLDGGAETDDINGGTGFDTVDFSGPGTAGVVVVLDDLPGDGQPGELDNIHSDVEDIFGTPDPDRLTGGPGNNILGGGSGDDEIDGAGGADRIDGDDGNDTITSRDGLAELIDCGDGVDTVIADSVDVTDGCENEMRSPEQQTDLDGDGAARPLDCNDGNAGIRPGAADVPDDGVDQNCDGADATDLDRDRDGFPRPLDCDDANARAHPGARERRGNRVDEDCNGRAEPFALVTNSVPNAWITQGATTRNLRLGVRDVRKGMTVQLRCRGGGCPLAKKTRKIKRRDRLLNLHPLLAGAALRPGAVIELRIMRRGAIGKVVRYSVRSGAVPQSRVLCLPPGKKRAREC